MTIASSFRPAGFCMAFATLLLGSDPVPAQERSTPPSQAGAAPAPVQAPVGHRQPRPADVPATEKTEEELQEERQQAELNRRLRICRGC